MFPTWTLIPTPQVNELDESEFSLQNKSFDTIVGIHRIAQSINCCWPFSPVKAKLESSMQMDGCKFYAKMEVDSDSKPAREGSSFEVRMVRSCGKKL